MIFRFWKNAAKRGSGKFTRGCLQGDFRTFSGLVPASLIWRPTHRFAEFPCRFHSGGKRRGSLESGGLDSVQDWQVVELRKFMSGDKARLPTHPPPPRPARYFDLCGWRPCQVLISHKEPKSDAPVAPPSTAARCLVRSDFGAWFLIGHPTAKLGRKASWYAFQREALERGGGSAAEIKTKPGLRNSGGWSRRRRGRRRYRDKQVLHVAVEPDRTGRDILAEQKRAELSVRFQLHFHHPARRLNLSFPKDIYIPFDPLSSFLSQVGAFQELKGKARFGGDFLHVVGRVRKTSRVVQ